VQQPTAGRQADELTAVLERLEPELRRVLVRFRIPAQDAEDLIQDTLLVFLTKHDTIASPAPWLLATLRNRCLVYWRRRRRHLIEAIDAGLLEEVAGGRPGDQNRRDLARDLSGAVSRLPNRCRSILRLRYGLECAGPEIAEQLGYRPDTIRQATLRCLSALSRQLLSNGYVKEAM
jgi:RNA polymerase sigma factor (sigma-70 family)